MLALVDRREAGFHCPNTYRSWLELAQRPEVKRVVLTSFWQGYFDFSQPSTIAINGSPVTADRVPEIFNATAKDLKRIADAGKEVVVLGPIPTSKTFDPELLVAEGRIPGLGGRRQTINYGSITSAAFQNQIRVVDPELRRLAETVGATLLQPAAYLCKDSNCPADARGKPLYHDWNHLRPFATKEYLPFFPALVQLDSLGALQRYAQHQLKQPE